MRPDSYDDYIVIGKWMIYKPLVWIAIGLVVLLITAGILFWLAAPGI